MSAARALLTLAAALGLAGPAAARADEPDAAAPALPAEAGEPDTARLENAFWACDYVATTQGIQATPAATCRYVTEELKQQKFGGSFHRFVEWWRVHKPAQHRRMARLMDP